MSSFLVDKLSLKFNLACAYSRMPSRMELSWDNKTLDEKGSIQGAQLYEKSADIYSEMITELLGLKNQDNWKEIKNMLGVDLQLKTLNMLKHVM